MSYWKDFVGTEKRVRIIQGKRAIRVRAIEVILYAHLELCYKKKKHVGIAKTGLNGGVVLLLSGLNCGIIL